MTTTGSVSAMFFGRKSGRENGRDGQKSAMGFLRMAIGSISGLGRRSGGKTGTIGAEDKEKSSERQRLVISVPQDDFRHTGHLGLDGMRFGNVPEEVTDLLLPTNVRKDTGATSSTVQISRNLFDSEDGDLDQLYCSAISLPPFRNISSSVTCTGHGSCLLDEVLLALETQPCTSGIDIGTNGIGSTTSVPLLAVQSIQPFREHIEADWSDSDDEIYSTIDQRPSTDYRSSVDWNPSRSSQSRTVQVQDPECQSNVPLDPDPDWKDGTMERRKEKGPVRMMTHSKEEWALNNDNNYQYESLGTSTNQQNFKLVKSALTHSNISVSTPFSVSVSSLDFQDYDQSETEDDELNPLRMLRNEGANLVRRFARPATGSRQQLRHWGPIEKQKIRSKFCRSDPGRKTISGIIADWDSSGTVKLARETNRTVETEQDEKAMKVEIVRATRPLPPVPELENAIRC